MWNNKKTIIQFATVFMGLQICGISAFSFVWPSYALTMLQSDTSPLGYKISLQEAGLVGSIPMLGSLAATLVAGYVADAIGRKRTLILSGLMFVTAWALILTARNIIQLLIGRFLFGFGSGQAIVAVVLFVSEVTHLSIRGNATAMIMLLHNCAVTVSYLHGWFLSYNAICYSSLTASVLYVVMMCFVPETPIYLLRLGKEKEALSAVKFYRGESGLTPDIMEELNEMKARVKHRGEATRCKQPPSADTEKPMLEEEKTTEDPCDDQNCWALLFTDAPSRRALISISLFMILAVAMGMISVQTYAGPLFAKAVPSLSPDMCSVLLAVVIALTCGISVTVTDSFPRRTIMIWSCAIGTGCLAVLGGVLLRPEAPAWVALLAIIVYSAFYNLGIMSLLFTVQAESFVPKVHGPANAIVFCVMFIANFAVLYSYIPIVTWIGISGTFFMYAAVGAVTTICLIFMLKETRGVPVDKVHQMYSRGYLYKKLDDYVPPTKVENMG